MKDSNMPLKELAVLKAQEVWPHQAISEQTEQVARSMSRPYLSPANPTTSDRDCIMLFKRTLLCTVSLLALGAVAIAGNNGVLGL